jgi:hypothetical protein
VTTTGYTLTRLLLEGDTRRPRFQQRELGMSAVGGCRRHAGYVLAGTEPTDPSASMQAVLGTAIDEAVSCTVRLFQSEGLIPAEDLVQHEVRYAGVLGHLDWYRSADACVDDTKTVPRKQQLGLIQRRGPSQQHRWQVSLYGAGLIKQGRPVRQVALTYLARDTGDEYRWVAPFDPGLVGEALAWLDIVRTVPLEQLPRDHDPDSQPCSWCPFRTACWGERVDGRDPRAVLFTDNPDAAYWAQQLADARAAKSDAEKLEKQAKGALKAIDPGNKTPIDVGLPELLRFNRYPVERFDEDAARKEYEAAGAPPPMKVTWQTRIEFVPREPSDEEDESVGEQEPVGPTP